MTHRQTRSLQPNVASDVYDDVRRREPGHIRGHHLSTFIIPTPCPLQTKLEYSETSSKSGSAAARCHRARSSRAPQLAFFSFAPLPPPPSAAARDAREAKGRVSELRGGGYGSSLLTTRPHPSSSPTPRAPTHTPPPNNSSLPSFRLQAINLSVD
ncbi:hypothetical protein C0Q70_16746 [Pomacea canaliculata]|uniref:Uncharacterized protein n=1 Tax=Pomacea canaliculata TaxID=400727 RepID=A0A2T7NQM2_POMCA|nr:hypothetical protein C0Q70_16746 [Pomacea canaliculata]